MYLAVPLLKGQISCREFMRGETLKAPIRADKPVDFVAIDSPFGASSDMARLIADRGLEPHDAKVVALHRVPRRSAA